MQDFHWSPGIGDPTPVGWLTVAAYFFTSWMCLRAFMSEKSGPARPYLPSIAALLRVLWKHFPHPPLVAQRAGMWLSLAALLTILGINKQLDFQTLLTDIARIVAKSQGWYEERRGVQVLFILGILAIGLWIGFRLFQLARGPLIDFRLALFGIIVLLGFVVARAASFHHMDDLLNDDPAGVRLNWIFELTGIGIVFVAARRRLKRASQLS